MTYPGLSELQAKRALETNMLLELLKHFGKLDDHLQGRVLDFGAGSGVSTAALKQFGGYVEAVDTSDTIDYIISRNILPQEQVHKTVGIKFLKDRPDNYDLVTAFMFGPIVGDTEPQSLGRVNQFLRDFYEAAKIGIKPNGKILITSDMGSFRHVEELSRQVGGEVLRYPTFPSVYFIGK